MSMKKRKGWPSIQTWLGRFRNRLLKRAGRPRPKEDEQRINVGNDIIVSDLTQNPLDQAAAEIKHLEDINQLNDLSRPPGADLLYPVSDSTDMWDMRDTIREAAYSTSGSRLQHEEGGSNMKQEEQERASQPTSESAPEEADWLDEDKFGAQLPSRGSGPLPHAVYECPNHGVILPQEVLWGRDGRPYCPHDKCRVPLKCRPI
jgi:hypothetical protein